TASGEGGVRLYDAKTGALVRALGDAGDRSVAFAPDGRTLVAAGFHMDKLVGVYDVQTGRRVRSLAGHTEWETYAHAFSPDGGPLAGGGGDKAVRLWDATTGQLRRSLEGHRDWVCTLAFAPDGRSLASGDCDWAYHRGRNTAYFAGRDPGCASQWKLWDAASGELKRTVTEPGRLRSLAFAPDGRSLAC